MISQISTVLVNLAELDPPRNGGMSRVARLVADYWQSTTPQAT